jgi:YceI-like domain
VSGDLTLHGVTKPVSVDVTRQNDAYVGTVRIKQTEFGIQPIKIGGGVVRVKDELEISHYERCAAFGKARPRNPPAPPLSMICRSPELYFVSCKAEGQASFCWPMGVTYADRAANYCSAWGAVRLMEVPPTSVAGLAGTSRSPAGPIITAPLNHTTMHKDGESQETNSAALGYSELMVSDNLVSNIRICVGLPS